MPTYHVRLTGWQTPRQIIVEDGKVFFEVAEVNHCSTCRSRLRHVEEVVARKGLEAAFHDESPSRKRHDGYAETVFVSLPAPENGEDPRAYVARELDLPIILN